MKRRPNTAHWQRLVSTCKETHGSGWRTAAARLLQCEKSSLRAKVDCDLDPVDIKKIDALLIAQLNLYKDYLIRRIDKADEAARAVMLATKAISTARPAITTNPTDNWPQFYDEYMAYLLEVI